MRESLNDNPVVQAIVIGVLLLGAAALVMMQMGGGSGGGGAPADSATATLTTPSGGSAEITATDNGDSTSISADVTVPNSPGVAAPAAQTAPAEFKAGPGLPRQLVSDHDSGRTIVLLIDKPGGIEDSALRSAVEGLRGDSGLAVYITDAKGIARFAQITQGVGVAQVPALVVVSPSRSGGAPRASVSYGFRSSDSVRQAVRDAVYRGDTRGYDPG
jgi:hypothetical protein